MTADTRRFFFLAGRGRDNYTTQSKARWVIRDTWLCVGCVSPKRHTGSVDIAVQETRPIDEDLGMIAGTDVGAGRLALFECLGIDDVRKQLHLGRLLREDGVTPFRGMVTYHGRHRIIVRGEHNAHTRTCALCGRNTYSALEYTYLYPNPPVGVEIFDAGQGELVISERLAERVDPSAWRGIELRALPVLDKPLDGMDELVSAYAPVA